MLAFGNKGCTPIGQTNNLNKNEIIFQIPEDSGQKLNFLNFAMKCASNKSFNLPL